MATKEHKNDSIDLLLILKAQEILRLSSRDPLHDYSHALRTCENAESIITREGLGIFLDKGLLRNAIWWHDVDRGRKDGDDSFTFKKYAEELNLSFVYVNKVVGIIGEHSFGKKQTTLESKVLYDADKLEYVSIPRVENLLRAKKVGLIEESMIEEFKTSWGLLIKNIEPTLNFLSTKHFFIERKKQFLDWGREIPDFAQLAASVV